MSEDESSGADVIEPIHASQYVAPVSGRRAFHCPHCGVYAAQQWGVLYYTVTRAGVATRFESHISRGQCFNCGESTYWRKLRADAVLIEDTTAVMVFPDGSANAPNPHPDFPSGPKGDYEEARAIVDRSPRGAVALLRLALQKLCKALGLPGKNINDDVASLVQSGLPPGVQEALDSLRVIGNNAVHPGQIDLKDDPDTAVALFGLINFIVEQMITRPKELKNIYAKLPPGAVAAIEKRDGGSTSS